MVLCLVEGSLSEECGEDEPQEALRTVSTECRKAGRGEGIHSTRIWLEEHEIPGPAPR
jgi:hypothetical protein